MGVSPNGFDILHAADLPRVDLRPPQVSCGDSSAPQAPIERIGGLGIGLNTQVISVRQSHGRILEIIIIRCRDRALVGRSNGTILGYILDVGGNGASALPRFTGPIPRKTLFDHNRTTNRDRRG